MRLHAALAALVLVATVTGGCLEELRRGLTPQDYLTDGKYTAWIIEVDYSKGHKPSQALLDKLEARMLEVVNKETVTARLGDELPASGRVWRADDLRKLAKDNQDTPTRGKTVVTHLLFLDGRYEEAGVLGVTFGRNPVVIFSQTIKDTCNTLGNVCLTDSNTATIFEAVTIHEFGHALGLVNNGLPMVRDHEDEQNEKHSSNQRSVMYWAVETSQILTLLRGGIPTTFDGDDKADLKHGGGK